MENPVKLYEIISHYISVQETIITIDMEKRDPDVEVRFTTFGHKAGVKAVIDIIRALDDPSRLKVLEIIKTKKVE